MSYIYELVRADGHREDVCMRFKMHTFKNFLMVDGRKIIVTKDTSTVPCALLHQPADVNMFLKTNPDVVLVPDISVTIRNYPKILIVGHARHGKDTVAELMSMKYGFRVTSSSSFATGRVIMPYFAKAFGPSYYTSEEACFEDRVNHRDTWYRLIGEYNEPDRTRMAREILKDHDAYCGMRHKREFFACKIAGLFKHVIWVDASDRYPPESSGSCTIEPWMADFILDNNGTLDELSASLDALMSRLMVRKLEE